MEKLIQNLNKTTHDLLQWVDTPVSRKIVGDETSVALKKRHLKRNEWRIKKLKRSLNRNSAVSVYGPSQAGKSFLVSILAKPEGNDLVANYKGSNNQLNYISEINPAGDGESTGIVTRFTSTDYECPDEHPIKVELLTEIDLVCTLCNSFYLDGDQKETISSDRIEQHLKSFELKLKQNTFLEISELWELQEYIHTKFRHTIYGKEILDYFERIAEIAAKLDLKDRADLYSVLWGFHTPLSDLFLKIANALEKVGFCETLFLQRQALVPKSNSIIDVKSLKGIDKDTDDTLSVSTANGRKTVMDRSIVSALIAELTIPMEITPHKFLEHTDLLDFPGARNRFKRSLSETFEMMENNTDEGNVTVGDLLLRGKISYLFDKYVAAQEITAMLLCIPDGNLEAVDLPILVEDWLEKAVGKTPIDRFAADNTLFFVLTKFDLHLNDTGSNKGETDRFKRRIEASLFEKFGKNKDNWLRNWDGMQSFKNCFWLRNPNVEQPFFERAGNLEKLNPDPSRKTRLAELKEMYLSTEEVQRHFLSPIDAWDAAIAPNDGGSIYLVNGLSEVCHADTKTNQVGNQLAIMSKALLSEFETYYVPDDFEKKREIQLSKFEELEKRTHVLICDNRFGEFLDKICLTEDSINALVPNLNRFRVEPIIAQCVEAWITNCERVRSDLINAYDFPDETACFILKELQGALFQKAFTNSLKNDLAFLDGFNLSEQFSLSRSICCDRINCVVTNPEYLTGSARIEYISEKDIELPETHLSPTEIVGKDWLLKVRKLVLENVTVSSGNSIDLENNNQLGKVLNFIQEKCLNG